MAREPTAGPSSRSESTAEARGAKPPDSGLPDARDGLTPLQRIVLWQLDEARRELGRERVPTVTLYGRVLEHASIDEAQLQAVLRSLGIGDRVTDRRG